MQHRRQLSLFAITVFGIFGFYDKLPFFAPSSGTYYANAKRSVHFNTDNNFQCELAITDPWDPTITKYLQSNIESCETNYRNLTYLRDGYVRVNPALAKEKTTCQWQCLIPGRGDSYTTTPWDDVSNKPTCDVFKVRCFTNEKAEEQYYENLHIQIIPKHVPTKSPPNPSAFNVHIFVVDSVSRSQGLRFLPKTLHYLQKNMEGIHFPYYNKVAYNSHPNGNAFLVGKAPPRDDIPPMITKVLADNQTFEKHYIGNILQRNGYVTLFNEDVFSIFPKDDIKPHHTLAPFSQEIVKFKKFNDTWLYDDQCQTTLDYNTNFFTEFVSTYTTKPKYTLNWNTILSHDQLNHLHVGDDVMLEFLKTNERELDNSFFILMGDHGPNFGYYRYEEVIGYEEMNPMFYISLPKSLRGDKKLLKILEQNTDKMVNHFDLYATLIEIAQSTGADIPLDTTIHGTSLFKPIPEGRDCSSMGISPMYCNCRYKKIPLSANDSIHREIIDSIFAKENQTIFPYREKCKVPVFDPTFTPLIDQILMPGTSSTLRVYRVIFETTPGVGRWWTHVTVKFTNDSMKVYNMIGFGNRMNPAGPRCFGEIMDFCFCKN